MNCAPIIIPTLNRKKHLKRCIDSLAKNDLAIESILIISVDYPPSEKYMKGYYEVKDYLLKTKDFFDFFKEVRIIFQKTNLGPEKNFEFLRNYVKKISETYIFTEDDNEFSKNFLKYINKGLDLFKDNENVVSICGYKDADFIYENSCNVIASKLHPAYGVGFWTKKNEKLEKDITEVLLSKYFVSKKSLRYLRKKNRMLYNIYITRVLLGFDKTYWNGNRLNFIDSVLSIYMHFTDYFCIVPVVSKSRTWGNDGSGVNMSKTDLNPDEEQKLDTDSNFDYKTSEIYFNAANYQIGNAYMEKCNSIKFNLKADIYYIILCFFRFNRNKALKFVQVLEKNK